CRGSRTEAGWRSQYRTHTSPLWAPASLVWAWRSGCGRRASRTSLASTRRRRWWAPAGAPPTPARLVPSASAPTRSPSCPTRPRSSGPQAEIGAHLRECVGRCGIAPHLHLNPRVTSAAWDSDQRCWRVETSRGPVTADALVAAAGGLAEPSVPELPGLDGFAGT